MLQVYRLQSKEEYVVTRLGNLRIFKYKIHIKYSGIMMNK